MNSTPSPELLDHLASLAGCLYLSDLHTSAYRNRVHLALLNTPASAFPEAAWRDAALYILNRTAPGGSMSQRELLLEGTRTDHP